MIFSCNVCKCGDGVHFMIIGFDSIFEPKGSGGSGSFARKKLFGGGGGIIVAMEAGGSHTAPLDPSWPWLASLDLAAVV